MKKLISAILAATMAFTMLTVPAAASTPEPVNLEDTSVQENIESLEAYQIGNTVIIEDNVDRYEMTYDNDGIEIIKIVYNGEEISQDDFLAQNGYYSEEMVDVEKLETSELSRSYWVYAYSGKDNYNTAFRAISGLVSLVMLCNGISYPMAVEIVQIAAGMIGFSVGDYIQITGNWDKYQWRTDKWEWKTVNTIYVNGRRITTKTSYMNDKPPIGWH